MVSRNWFGPRKGKIPLSQLRAWPTRMSTSAREIGRSDRAAVAAQIGRSGGARVEEAVN